MTPLDRSLPKAPQRSPRVGMAATLPFSLPRRVAADTVRQTAQYRSLTVPLAAQVPVSNTRCSQAAIPFPEQPRTSR